MDFEQLLVELDYLPANNRLAYIQEMGNDFNELMETHKNPDDLQQLLLRIPYENEGRAQVITRLGFDFIYNCIRSAEELAEFISIFTSEEAFDLICNFYWHEPNGHDVFCEIVSSFEELIILMCVLDKEYCVCLLEYADRSLIQNYNELNIVLRHLNEDDCGRLLLGHGANLAEMMKDANVDDALNMLQAAPQAQRAEILANMGAVFYDSLSENEKAQLQEVVNPPFPAPFAAALVLLQAPEESTDMDNDSPGNN
ncbi:MAG: hypothetical protein K0R66_752 [Gammaproteobacteria bacterium]|nr:hypothetical protein [Gammaproteobacteria bacterium]